MRISGATSLRRSRWYQSYCGPSAWPSSASSALGRHSEHGGAGPTAPDGVAGDSACQDLGLGGGAGGSDRQECWPGTGRSRLQHLLSTRVVYRLQRKGQRLVFFPPSHLQPPGKRRLPPHSAPGNFLNGWPDLKGQEGSDGTSVRTLSFRDNA